MRPIRKIIVHHTAGPSVVTVAEIDREHRARGFSCIGYHYVVHQLRPAGPWLVSVGRDEDDVGAHDQGQNADSIGVVVAGDYSRGPVPAHAWTVLVATVAALVEAYRLSPTDVEGHRENEPSTTPTLCPGFSPERLRLDVTAQLFHS